MSKSSSTKTNSLKTAIRSAHSLSSSSSSGHSLSAHNSVVSALSRSTPLAPDAPELLPRSIPAPDGSGVLSLCPVPRLQRLYVGLSNGAIAYYSTKKWKLRGCLPAVLKGRIYALIHVPPCWLWAACDTGMLAVCRISGHGASLAAEHAFSVHNGQMVKSLLWSPVSDSSSIDSLLLKGQPRLFPGQTDGGHQLPPLSPISSSSSVASISHPFSSHQQFDDDALLTHYSESTRTEVSEEQSLADDDASTGSLASSRAGLFDDDLDDLEEFSSSASGESLHHAGHGEGGAGQSAEQDVVWSASPEDSSISVWDARTLALQLTLSIAQPTVLLRVWDRVWVGCFQRIVVYNRVTYTPIWLVTNAHSHLINDMVQSPATSHVWSCANDGLLKCWDPHSFQLLATVDAWVPIDSKVLALAPVADALWSAGFADQILGFNAHSRIISLECPSRHRDSVRCIRLVSHSDAQGSVVATGGRDGVLNVWRIPPSSEGRQPEGPSQETLAEVEALVGRLHAQDAGLKEIRLAGRRLGPQHVSLLLQLLGGAGHCVEALDLSHNALGNAGAALIADVLPKTRALRELSFVHNEFSASGFKSLYRGIRQNWSICSMHLGEFNMDANSVALYHSIASCVRSNHSFISFQSFNNYNNNSNSNHNHNSNSNINDNPSSLSLGARALSSIPKFLIQPQWAASVLELDLSHNSLAKLPSAVLALVNLRSLNVSRNKLLSLPNLAPLSSLRALDCSHNQLSHLPLTLCALRALASLAAAHNQVRQLPLLFGLMPRLSSIDLSANPVACHSVGPGATFGSLSASGTLAAHARCLQGLPIELTMLRLALIGAPGAGKTTFLKRLRGFDSGRGKAPSANAKASVGYRAAHWMSRHLTATSCHVVDFSGEACVHYATHPSLLPDLGVYGVVFDVQQSDEQAGIAYWLSCISLLCPSASIVLLATHCDLVEPHAVAARLKALSQAYAPAYPHLRLVASVDFSPSPSSADASASPAPSLSPSAPVDVVGLRPLQLMRRLVALSETHEPFCRQIAALPQRYLALSELVLAMSLGGRHFFSCDEFEECFQFCGIPLSRAQDAIKFLVYTGRIVVFDLETGLPPAGLKLVDSILAVESIWLSSVLVQLTTSTAIAITPSPSDPLLPVTPLSALWDRALVDPQLLPVMVFLLEALDLGFKTDSVDAIVLPFLLPTLPPPAEKLQKWWQGTPSALGTAPAFLAASTAPSAIHADSISVSGSGSGEKHGADGNNSVGESVRFFDFDWVPINLFSKTLIRLLSYKECFKVRHIWKTGILLETCLPPPKEVAPPPPASAGRPGGETSLLFGLRRRTLRSTVERFMASGPRDDLASSLQGSNLSNMLNLSGSSADSNASPLSQGIKVSISLNPGLKRLSLTLMGPEYQRSNAFLFFINAFQSTFSSQNLLQGRSKIPCPVCCHFLAQERPAEILSSTVVALSFNDPGEAIKNLDSKNRSRIKKLFRTVSKAKRSSAKGGVPLSPSSSSSSTASSDSPRGFSIPCWDVEEITEKVAQKESAFLRCKTCELSTRVDLVAPDIAFSAYQGLLFTTSEIQPLKIIGEGSTAIVTQAKYGKNVVAVKRLLPPEDLEISDAFPVSAVSRFRQEAWMMTVYRHPNIIPLLGVCLQPPALMLPYMERGDLYQFIHNPQNELPTALIISLLRDIARAVNFLHTCQPPVIHRDLRPPNIFLRFSKKLNRVQAILGDFGLSTLLVFTTAHRDNSEDIQNAIYSAPEIITNHMFSTQSDVFAWGMTTWELVTRQKPYAACKWMWEVEKMVIAGERPAVAEDQFPSPLYQLVLSAFRAEPSERCSFAHILSVLPRDHKS